jgi:prefoldin subunit 5
MYGYLHNPMFWGNNARHFKSGGNGAKTDMWVFDPDMPAPDGVEIYYNTHEPVYKDEIAEKVKAELRRRRLAIRGTNRPDRSHAFSGLFVCAKCGYTLVYKGNKGYPSYGCNSRHWQNEKRSDCDERKSLPAWKIQKWLDARLSEMMEIGEPTIFMADTSNEIDFYNRRISDLRKEIDDISDKIRRIVRVQATVETDAAREIYAEEVNKFGKQLQKMRDNLSQLERAKPSSNVLEGQVKAFKEIQEISLDSFWELPEVEMNQLLHQVFGTRRLAVKNGEIIGVVEGKNL